MSNFEGIGVIRNSPIFDSNKLDYFAARIEGLYKESSWNRSDLLDIFLK